MLRGAEQHYNAKKKRCIAVRRGPRKAINPLAQQPVTSSPTKPTAMPSNQKRKAPIPRVPFLVSPAAE